MSNTRAEHLYVQIIERTFGFVKQSQRRNPALCYNSGILWVGEGDRSLVERLRETRLLPVIVGLVIVGIILLALRLANVLSPFLWAALAAYLLYPLVIRLERGLRLPRVAVIAILYVFVIGFLIFVGFQLIPTTMEQVRSLIHSLPQLIKNAQDELVREPELHLGGFVINTRQIETRIDDLAGQFASRFGKEAVPLVLQTAEFLVRVAVFLIATFYFLLQGDTVLRRLRDLAPRRYRDPLDQIVSQVNQTFGAYIRAQLILFVIMSLATFTVLSILGVQYALVVALASGLLELVPIIGPWVAASVAVLVAISGESTAFGWSPARVAIAVAISYFVLRMLEDHVVIPQLVGRIVRVHPVLVIFGVLAGASLGGMLGLLVAVPILAALKIVGEAVIQVVRNPPPRRVVLLRAPGALSNLLDELVLYADQHLVLLIAHGACDWDDLEIAQRLAAAALAQDIRLQVVTPDRLAGSIATAAGIEVVTRVTATDERALALEQQTLAAQPAAAPASEPAAKLAPAMRPRLEGDGPRS